MKKIITYLFILFGLQSGAQTYFNKRYNNYQSWWDYSWNISADSSKIYWTYGTSTGLGLSGLRMAVISVLDYSGNFINTVNYADTFNLYYFGGAGSLSKLSNGFILGASKVDTIQSDAALLRLNNAGDTVWTRTYGDQEFQSGWMAIENWDGGFLLCGQTASTDTFSNGLVIRTDSLGNLLWQTEIGLFGHSELFYSLCRTSNGCALAGRTRDLSNASFDNYIACVDSLGNLIWDTILVTHNQDEATSITSTVDGNFVIAGYYAANFLTWNGLTYPYIAKFDINGNLIWEKKYGDSLTYTGFNSIRELHDSSLILCGNYRPTNGDYQGLIYKVSANGDSIWSHYYYNGFYSDNYLQDIYPTSDGGFVSCGYIVPSLPDTGHQDLWLLKIDSLGCEHINCTMGISGNEFLENEFLIYPNPFKDYLTIKTTRFFIKNGLITISDLLGREIFQTIFSVDDLTVDLSQIPIGIFVINIISDNKVLYKNKIVRVNY
jgi:hypothetical protein